MSLNPEIGTRVRTGSFETNVHDSGRGAPVLLLLHGSGSGVSAWANWRLLLPVLAQTRRVLAPAEPDRQHALPHGHLGSTSKARTLP